MSNLLQQLSRELGTDARTEALRRHSELKNVPAEELIQAIEEILRFHSWPVTTEYCEKAYHWLASSGELEKLTVDYASAPTQEGFQPKPDEAEFLRTAPIEEVGKYLQAKHKAP